MHVALILQPSPHYNNEVVPRMAVRRPNSQLQILPLSLFPAVFPPPFPPQHRGGERDRGDTRDPPHNLLEAQTILLPPHLKCTFRCRCFPMSRERWHIRPPPAK